MILFVGFNPDFPSVLNSPKDLLLIFGVLFVAIGVCNFVQALRIIIKKQLSKKHRE